MNAADFFANHPFHLSVEELSRRILAPAGEDGYRETKWFYERARGQYADERGRRTPSERKKFDSEYPRSQFFTKTDIAKYENTWARFPHIVSRGAQKNFAAFVDYISKNWNSDDLLFDETWFKRSIAKAIVFRTMEKLVSRSDWYEGGYRANIVTYAISKVVHDAEYLGVLVDLDSVWRYQEVPSHLEALLTIAGIEAQKVITNPPEGVRNCSEWAKKEACWDMLAKRSLWYRDDDFERTSVPRPMADTPTNGTVAAPPLGRNHR